MLGGVYLALADSQWDRAVALAEADWDVLRAAHVAVLRAVAEAVPPHLLSGRPRWDGLQLLGRRRLSAPPGALDAAVDDAGWREIAELTARSRSARVAGEIAVAVESAFAARDAFHRISGRGEVPSFAPRLMFEWALAFVVGGPMPHTGWDTQPEEQLDEAFSWALARDDHETAARAAAEMAWLQAFAGRSGAAAQWIERAKILGRIDAEHGAGASPIRIAQSMRRGDRLDFAGALEALSSLSGDHLFDHRILAASAGSMYAIHLGGDDAERADERLRRVCEVSPRALLGAPLNRAALAYAESYRLVLDGRPAQALSVLDGEPGRRPAFVEARRASALLHRGDGQAAELAAIMAYEAGAVMPRFAVEALAVLAVVKLRSGSRDAARQVFGRAVDLADRHRLPAALGLVSQDELAALAALVGRADSPSLNAMHSPRMRRPTLAHVFVPLTPQERRVTQTIGSGLSVRQAAERLAVSENTVKTQLQAVYRKLGVTRRSELVAAAREHGLL
ncbi:hypothetical protein GCM10022202_07770 [Microbacterium marinilacus]|uniref:HTH luxR-type domain-containing protein n=1 Tax=Microbacterium marinilacus TaxID=415209 RepID=A0ABP7B652_9MICO